MVLGVVSYVWLYNQQLPQSDLGSKTPLQTMKDWNKLKPELFKKKPYYLPGCDSYGLTTTTARTSLSRFARKPLPGNGA
tara:strand:+ start:3425 stop:3661 length:237 start_codon:yes stop_codon:yes gene_type:complete